MLVVLHLDSKRDCVQSNGALKAVLQTSHRPFLKIFFEIHFRNNSRVAGDVTSLFFRAIARKSRFFGKTAKVVTFCEDGDETQALYR
jgi:hypothetical protein